ncbi:stage II sporulation protein Q [Salsuginibacillus halophilus]|uniref:Stage II sporulation protein Q n=1 Tax=Salsuginibacillus halophilus TaxID=517424 RepID=A0A2P8HHT7_9BACI|nr:M23 family metallopeptidase [Salsuginibacillus halophilus]PSL45767.1 stage II sporulation protein Q [Salsuginibacillus halophilus]
MRDEEKQKQQGEKLSVRGQLKQWSKQTWFWPAAYLSLCAVLLGSFFLVQGGGPDEVAEPFDDQGEQEDADDDGDGGMDEEEEAVPVGSETEAFEMPVISDSNVDIIGTFYQDDASAEEQEQSLVYYNQMYYRNTGIDLAKEDGEAFDVTAAASGEVIRSEQDPLLGHVIEIEHEDEVTTLYNSLEDPQVEEGDVVEKSAVIGSAGRNLFNSDAGVHAHFEIRAGGTPHNPEDIFGESVEDIAVQAKYAESDEPSTEVDENELPPFPEEDSERLEDDEDEEDEEG